MRSKRSVSKSEAADRPEQLPRLLPEDAFLDFTRHIMRQRIHKSSTAFFIIGLFRIFREI